MNSVNIFEISEGVLDHPDSSLHTPREQDNSDWKHSAIAQLPDHLYRPLEDFELINKIDEGTYGAVYRATNKQTGEVVALKQIKSTKETEAFSVAAARRELELLMNLWHPNIVTGNAIALGSKSQEVFLIMEYIPYELKNYMETLRSNNKMFSAQQVKCLMSQLLTAVEYIHENFLFHRDLKTNNILLTRDGFLKVADFGMARELEFSLCPYTPGVVTLWYRAPELLLLSKEYSLPIDMWSVGCIFAELITLKPLFPGTTEMDQLKRIFMDLGTPSDVIWPGYSTLPLVRDITFDEYPPAGLRKKIDHELLSDCGLSLLQALLTYDPMERVTAADALKHAYFKEQPLAVKREMFFTSLESEDEEEYSGSDTGEEFSSHTSSSDGALDNDADVEMN
ncbi:hypothetical protein HW555_001242 [Spodoptera exigua]|uniref:Protein kinase domain-containing protein n=1 Tax=Spodoptera exigua TaxID=7107 RepID=A0A835GS10_SPOEX|nr:hypothetical protein HW555_001242 [Spodoptera exigua]